MPRITTDLIVGSGLVLALLMSIGLGGGTELQTNIASGLVGFLGRAAIDHKEGIK